MNSPRNILPAFLALALTLVAAGCNHTISESKKTTVGSDGTVRSKETTVTQRADGSVVKTEETKKTTPR